MPDMDPRSIEDREHRIGEIDDALAAFQARYQDRKFPEHVREEWNELNSERDEHVAAVVEMRKRRQRITELARNPAATERGHDSGGAMIGRLSGDPWRNSTVGSGESRARAAVDQMHRESKLSDSAAERAERLVRSDDLAQEWLLACSDPAYERAFARWVADPQQGHTEWDSREQKAWRRVRQLAARLEARQMEIGAPGTGGSMVPVMLDPAILLTSDGSINPLRQIARTATITTSQWRGVTSDGATAEWLPESQEAADGTPAVPPVTVDTHKFSVFVPFSVEWEGDASNALRELQAVIRDAADNLQAEAFTNGTGVGDTPIGVVAALPAGSLVNTAGAFSAANVTALQNALPARFQSRARWTGNLAVLNRIGEFETTNGALRFPEIAGADPMLLRKPVHELSNMSGDMTTTSSQFLLYGDFSQFLIVDRVGARFEVVQHLIGANRRPTGQRGAWLWGRTGSDVLVDNAFRLANKTT